MFICVYMCIRMYICYNIYIYIHIDTYTSTLTDGIGTADPQPDDVSQLMSQVTCYKLYSYI